MSIIAQLEFKLTMMMQSSTLTIMLQRLSKERKKERKKEWKKEIIKNKKQ